MMARSIGAQLGLLAFSVAVVAGLYAGNTATTILFRALIVMVVACVIGQAIGLSGWLILREHLRRRKAEIDQQHQDALKAIREQIRESQAPASEDPEAAAVETGS